MIQSINTIKVLHALIVTAEAMSAGEIARFWESDTTRSYPILLEAQKSGYVEKRACPRTVRERYQKKRKPDFVWTITTKGIEQYFRHDTEFYFIKPSKELLGCGKCGTRGVRLYRPVGEKRDPSLDRCNACLSEKERNWYVPLLSNVDGTIWSLKLVAEKVYQEFLQLPEKNFESSNLDE